MAKPAFDPSKPYQVAAKPAFDPNQPFTPVKQEKGLVDSALDTAGEAGQWALENVAAPIGKFVDTYTGAPSRKALSTLVDKKGLLEAGGQFIEQFGADPEKAPTGKDIAQKLGVGDKSLSDAYPGLYSETGEGLPLKKGGFLDPTASGAAGLGVDVATDWTNLIPGAVAAKGLLKAGGKTVGGTAKLAGKTAAVTADVVTGTKVSTNTARALGVVTEKTGEIINKVLNPKQSIDFPKAVEIAKKNGIEPSLLSSSIEFGPTSGISRLERNLSERAGGETLLKNHEDGYNAISDALNRKVDSIAGKPVGSDVEAGALIRDSFAKSQNNLLGSMEMTYKKAGTYAPGLRINKDDLSNLNSTLNGVEKYAKGMIKRGIDNVDKQQGQQLLRAVEGVRATKGSYKQSVEALERIGRKAFNSKPIIGQVPPDIDKLQDIYFKLSDSIINTVRKDVNPEFADELVRNNKTMSDFFSKRSVIKGSLESGRADETLFRNLIGSGDSKKISALRGMLPPEDIQALKGAFLRSTIKPDINGVVSFKQVANALRTKKNIVESLFSPQEIQEITELVKLGDDFGPSVLSHSGTGASQGFLNFPKQVVSSFADEKWLNAQKAKARGKSSSVSGGLIKESSEIPQSGLLKEKDIPSLTVEPGLLRRGPIEKRLKATQSIAPSYYNRENKK